MRTTIQSSFVQEDNISTIQSHLPELTKSESSNSAKQGTQAQSPQLSTSVHSYSSNHVHASSNNVWNLSYMNKQEKEWQGDKAKSNSIETWSSAKTNASIVTSMKRLTTYFKQALANSHSFKLFKVLQALMKEKKVFNNGEMEEWER